MRDPYDVLGVPRGATQDDIKKSYRALARERHPDRHPGNPWAEDQFKEIAAAYDLLSDPTKRAAFDRGEIDAAGNQVRRRAPGAGWTRGFGGAAGGPFARGRRKKAWFEEEDEDVLVKVRGANVKYTLSVPFIDAARGCTKRITTASAKTLDVRVPPGTTDGQTLRLKGQGLPGLGGAEAGDALVTVQVTADPLFAVEDLDVRVEVNVTLAEAVLGGRIEVPTIHGPVALTVPEGSNSGTRLRLKGKGLAAPGREPGDQYVRLTVVLPPGGDRELADFVRKWSPRHPYDARRKG